MTGPIDATGAVGGVKGKNVLWAYVCGDYGEGSPGNRVMAGHSADVVSAAWAKEGGTAVTGDAAGRVIVWDAKTMKEAGRLELGGRIASLAVSDDGTRTAAAEK
jgi:WD40 repeat protein